MANGKPGGFWDSWDKEKAGGELFDLFELGTPEPQYQGPGPALTQNLDPSGTPYATVDLRMPESQTDRAMDMLLGRAGSRDHAGVIPYLVEQMAAQKSPGPFNLSFEKAVQNQLATQAGDRAAPLTQPGAQDLIWNPATSAYEPDTMPETGYNEHPLLKQWKNKRTLMGGLANQQATRQPKSALELAPYTDNKGTVRFGLQLPADVIPRYDERGQVYRLWNQKTGAARPLTPEEQALLKRHPLIKFQ